MNDTKMIRKTYSTEGSTMVVNGKFTEDQIQALKLLEGFDKVFWAEKVLWMNDGDVSSNGDQVLRTKNGGHYVTSGGILKGFGGREFIYRLLDKENEEHRTTNLWSQGTIPAELKHILIPNATIEQADGYKSNF